MSISTNVKKHVKPTRGADTPLKYIKTHPDGIYVQMYREGKSISKLFPKNTDLKEVIAYRDKLVAENKQYFYQKTEMVSDFSFLFLFIILRQKNLQKQKRFMSPC